MTCILKRIFAVLIAVLIMVSALITASADENKEVTVLFTHDLHSHFLPSKTEDGGEFGGYARLMTAINEQKEKYPDAILVDGGDFSMGSLFQTCFATDALELRLMGQMGFDVTTLGNHEFDYLPEGLSSMLNTSVESKDKLPQIVNSNYLPPAKGEAGYNEEIYSAFENYGVKDYTIIERGGVYFAVFGIFGIDSDDCAPNSGMILEDASQVAQETVNTAIKDCKEKYGAEPVVVCLSHSGTENGKGEDYELAENVEGIDLIVSAHTHTTFSEPVKVNDTYIVSAGEYGKNLGVVNMSFDGDSAEVTDYTLVPIDENVAEDKEIAQKVQEYKEQVEVNYLAKYGVSFDEIIVDNPFEFESVDEVYATQHDSDLGNLFADAYKSAVEKATGQPVDVALTAAGVIRETLPQGKVTTSDIFNAASLGVGTEGELVKVYISGKELKAALEVDASVQPIMKSAQLFFSGVEYSFNTNRMIFNKIDKAYLVRNDGTREEIVDDKIYSVVTGMYVGQMLGSVKEKSFGLLSIIPKDINGNPLEADELVNHVVYNGDAPLKEWYAITAYLKAMNGGMSAYYDLADGRKTVYKSLAPDDMLRNANVFTYVAIALVLLILALIILVAVLIIRKIKKRKNK
ncbi:MAG: bifunctional metallophosphatase/5'-nucleotidase [Clostridia bacterium]|nr:bifunctional metallophosphatase/5'-nucleotidase [Clostridia bacterium]